MQQAVPAEAGRVHWLNGIEPYWVHGKRNVMDSGGLLSARQLAERVCAYLSAPKNLILLFPKRLRDFVPGLLLFERRGRQTG